MSFMHLDSPDSIPSPSSGFAPTPVDLSTRSTFVFLTGREWRHEHLPVIDHSDFLAQLAPLLAIPMRHLVCVYPLAVTPHGLPAASQIVLAHRVFDVALAHLKGMVLCDVIYHQTASHGIQVQPHIDRLARWLPVQLTRSQLLAEFDLDNHCGLRGLQCLVLHNAVLVPAQFRGFLDLQCGDYVVIHVPFQAESANTGVCPPSSGHIGDSLSVSQPHPEPPQVVAPVSPDVNFGPEEIEAVLLGQDPLIQQLFMQRQRQQLQHIEVAVWFLHHETFRRCHRPQIVQLPRRPLEWDRILQQAWSDVWDSQLPYRVAVVRPEPPSMLSDVPSQIAHLIIEQAWAPPWVGVLMSVVAPPQVPHIHPQLAAVVPVWSNAEILQRQADVPRLQEFECQVWIHEVRLGPEVRSNLHAGLSIYITMQPRPQQSRSDLMALLQLSYSWTRPRASALEDQSSPSPVSTHDMCKSSQFMQFTMTPTSMTSATAVTRPTPGTGETEATGNPGGCGEQSLPSDLGFFVPDIHVEPDTMHRLMQSFTALSNIEQPEEVRGAYVAVYYLSDRIMHQCQFARTVRVHGDPRGWTTQFVNAWRGLVDPGAPVSVHMTEPHPPTNPSSLPFAGYILLRQHPTEEHVPVLVTQIEMGDYGHSAHLLFPALIERHVVWSVGKQLRCYSQRPADLCIVTYRGNQINNRAPTVVPAGAGILFSLIAVTDVTAAAAEAGK